MTSRLRIVSAALASLLAAAALCAPSASAGVVGAVRHFPTHCAVDDLVAGPEGDVWFPCNQPGKVPAPGGESLGRAAIAHVTPDGKVSELSAGLPPRSALGDLVFDPDGNLWFTLGRQTGSRSAPTYTSAIGRLSPSGEVAIFSAGLRPRAVPGELTLGADGSLWFEDFATPARVGRVTPEGSIAEYPVALPKALAIGGLAAGADGSIWFTQEFDLPRGDGEPGGLVGKVSADGTVASFGSAPAAFGAPIAGPDGNVWFVESSGRTSIDRVTPEGQISRFGVGTLGLPSHLAAGPDGNVWFTAQRSVGRVTPSGEVSTFTDCLDYHEFFSEATTIVPGSADDLWFLSVTSRQLPSIAEPPTIGRVTTDGRITQFRDGIVGEPTSIVAGSDGGVWFSSGLDEVQHIAAPTAPVATFILGRAEAGKGGATEVGVEVPGPGTIRLQPIEVRLPGGVVKGVGGGAIQKVAPACGQTPLRLKLRGAALAELRGHQPVKLKLRVTFIPTGGTPNTEVRTVLVRPRRR